MMKKYLEYNDEKSSKFWEIQVDGNIHTVRYGKTGVSGQTKTKTFTDESEAIKDAEKLVSTKVKKGYVEVSLDASTTDYTEIWEKITVAKNLKSALVNHFSFLADTKGFTEVLNEIMELATSARIEKDRLVITFQEDDLVLECSPPDKQKYKNYPASMQRISSFHGQIKCGELIFDAPGQLDLGAYDEEDTVYKLFAGDYNNVKEVIWEMDSNTIWLFHPTEKNSSGNDALFSVSHEMENEINLTDNNPGSIFLDRLIKLQQWPIILPKMEDKTETNEETTKWWECIAYALNENDTIFHYADNEPLTESFSDTLLATIIELALINLSSFKDLPLEKMSSLKKLSVNNKELAIKKLDGIEKAKNIEGLEVDNHELTTLEPLMELNTLTSISLRGNKIKDITHLKNCINLKRIYLSDNPIKSIDVMSNFPNLEVLWIDDTAVKDISILENAKKLKELSLPSRLSEKKVDAFEKAMPDVEIDY
jgi:predicted DNA-binding WGR domain protein